jgi:hypothetical protein
MRNKMLCLVSFALASISGCGGGGGGDAAAAPGDFQFPALVDANGHFAGWIGSLGPSSAVVVLTINNAATSFTVGDGGNTVSFGHGYAFESLDCSGTPYTEAAPRLTNELLPKLRGVYHVAPRKVAPLTVTTHSRQWTDCVPDSDPNGATIQAVEAVALSPGQSAAIDALAPPFGIGSVTAAEITGI